MYYKNLDYIGAWCISYREIKARYDAAHGNDVATPAGDVQLSYAKVVN
jgi:hypothetical protein